MEPIEVTGGCFHPKFMLLDGDAGPRLVVGSGNLTFSGWGRNLELAEILSPEHAPTAFADMAGFLDALTGSSRLDFPGKQIAASWVQTLRRLEGGDDRASLRLIHNVERSIAEQLVGLAERYGGATALLIASPYFGRADAVRTLARALGVERPEVHVSSALALAGQHYDFVRDPAARPVVVASLDEGARQRPMHAKLLEITCRDAVLTVSGSVNASGPALARPENVELAVVRIRSKATPRRKFKGDLPPLPSAAPTADGGSILILRATLIGRTLAGAVVGSDATGSWQARLDATGLVRKLGEVQIGADRTFAIEIAAADVVSFGTRRAVLVLDRGEERISGFVAFPDLLELNRRFGSSAGAMIRVIGGSTEDEDLAGVLEYYARHPDETTAPWANGGQGSTATERASDDPHVALSELDIRARDDGVAIYNAWGSSTALDRLVAAARRALSSAPAGSGSAGGGDKEDAGPGEDRPPPPERTDKIFETLCEIFGARVPHDPPTELHRLGELGICVLARRPDAERVAAFLAWWCGLAAAHLKCPASRPELSKLTIAFLLMDGLSDRSPTRTRRRLASIVGPVEPALAIWQEAMPPAMQGLIAEATAGMVALERFANEVLAERSPLEDLPALVAAIREGAVPPSLPSLDGQPEMVRLRRRIAEGHSARVPVARMKDAACPNCHVGLPQADLARLRTVGLVVAKNCCGRVVVLDPELE
ncbi:MAG TPA: hypothetical protein VFW19_18000 [Allosphingosinicella sp.]|nr:hypothetical protein [Allosphingosinicella sp.]